MVPLACKPGKAFDENEFRNHIIELCRLHHEQRRALAFAFLVYDFSNHAIKEVLENKNYWSSLDIIAGKYLSIFYIDSRDEYFNRRKMEIYFENCRHRYGNSNGSNMLGYLVPLKPPLSPIENTINILKKELNIQNHVSTPFIVFFQVIDSTIIDTFVIMLKKEIIEESLNEIKQLIQDAVDGVKSVSPENIENYEQIFYLITENIKNSRIRHTTIRLIKTFSLDLIFAIFAKLTASF
jgi:hypothetical protein